MDWTLRVDTESAGGETETLLPSIRLSPSIAGLYDLEISLLLLAFALIFQPCLMSFQKTISLFSSRVQPPSFKLVHDFLGHAKPDPLRFRSVMILHITTANSVSYHGLQEVSATLSNTSTSSRSHHSWKHPPFQANCFLDIGRPTDSGYSRLLLLNIGKNPFRSIPMFVVCVPWMLLLRKL